ncbi:hypothetical protein N8684_00060 [bacterium]|jgi:hypothetical protein|nr:hypothetical protein [Bacteroidota bacterium]MDA7625634.1 hypothetical protein [bacterium]MDF1863452.1 hypothetical protein [Saprospiraceae bacterium]
MHDIEPHYRWRDRYIASEDKQNPFFGRTYDEFMFTQKIYNYYIHPQWDNFGSATLYIKILFVDYEKSFAIFEMMGEWNDAIQNDIMFLKRDVADELTQKGISKFIIICENVLNFHGSDELYYEEWFEDVNEESGWICFLNLFDHVEQEMRDMRIHHYASFGGYLNGVNWRTLAPKGVFKLVEQMLSEENRKYLPIDE